MIIQAQNIEHCRDSGRGISKLILHAKLIKLNLESNTPNVLNSYLSLRQKYTKC